MDQNNNYRRTPSEVAADASIEHTGKGVVNTVKGRLRQAWGAISGNNRHQFGGKVDELKGRAQTELGKWEARESQLESGNMSRRSGSSDDETYR
ncbi:MAG TPA: CsbD family protein [Thermoanaerobaculia bacterium]|nr:CsbD family protein [Thermoanaerobaculia bacterium]